MENEMNSGCCGSAPDAVGHCGECHEGCNFEEGGNE